MNVRAKRTQQDSRKKPVAKFLWWFNSLAVSVLLLWFILGQGLVWLSEKPLIQARTEILQQYPGRWANAAALELAELAEPLGINLPIESQNSRATNLSPVSRERAVDPKVWEDLRTFLQTQSIQSEDKRSFPSELLQRYLVVHEPKLQQITDLLLHNETPFWGQMDWNQTELTYAVPLPSFLSLHRLNQLLLLDGWEQHRLGHTQIALDRFAAAWKLPQSLQTQPYLIASLVALIMANQQVGIFRQIAMPVAWSQKYLPILNWHQFFLNTFNFETIISSPPTAGYALVQRPFIRLLDPFLKPYFILAAADYWQKFNRLNQAIFQQDQQNFCTLDVKGLTQLLGQLEPWNIYASYGLPTLASQWEKLGKHLLNWELTQKIWQVKAVALQTGRFPNTLPGLTSSAICKNNLWTYHVSTSGQEIALSLAHRPAWLEQREKDLPLTYTAKIPPQKS